MRSREVPRWRRNKFAPAAPVVMTGRQARRLARQGMTVWPPGQQPATSPVPGMSPRPSVPASHVMRRTGAFRFRRHLVPFAWLAVLAGLGFGLPLVPATVAGLAVAAVVGLAWRHLPAAVLSAAVIPLESAEHLSRPWPVVYLAAWLAVAVPWLHRCRWRPAAGPPPPPDEVALWAATLGEKGRLAGTRLTGPQVTASGGRKFRLLLVPGQHDTSDVFAMARKIASLFGKPVTEAFPERLPDGREDQVDITVIERAALIQPRRWDGKGIDPATGMAVIGRFPDGAPVHFRYFIPRNGCRQSIVAGVMGSGKTSTLDLLIAIAVVSSVPIVPIIMDPQGGQSLPEWRGKVMIADTPEMCMRFLRAIAAGATARSEYLARLEWADADGVTHPGMGFFDSQVTGLPIILPILDEAHLVLNEYEQEARLLLANMTKLNRKAGIHLVLVAHNLLLEELKSSTMVANLVGSNVICLRTGEKMSAGKLGMEASPHELPMHFADGSPTTGLGYSIGPDGRPDSPMRIDHPGNVRKIAVDAVTAEMDEVFGKAFRASLAAQDARAQAAKARPGKLAAVPDPEDDAPEGRKAVDAVWQVFRGRDGDLDRGEVLKQAATVAKGWGRKRPFSVRSVQDALDTLTADGRITKARHGIYRASPGQDATTAGG